MPRSAVLLESELLDELVAATGAGSKADAVREAVRERLRALRLARIRSAAGQIDLSKTGAKRHDDRRLG